MQRDEGTLHSETDNHENKNRRQFSRMIEDIEPDRKSLPVLLRQYLRLGARILAFNVDGKFGNVLDGLMVVDLREIGPAVLTRYMGASAMLAFRAYHGLDDDHQPLRLRQPRSTEEEGDVRVAREPNA